MCGIASAQTADSVVTTAGTFDAYYDFETGSQILLDRTTWDIGLTTDPRSSSVIINENAGVELFLYSNDTADWSSIDTTAFTFSNIYNSEESWDNGAFSNLGTNHPDYGWGMYDMNSHDINGSRLFIIKTNQGEYLKMIIDKMSSTGDFKFRTANLDGTNLNLFSLKKSTDRGKNFTLVDLSTPNTILTNPFSKDWDILFTKYYTEVVQGPTVRIMPVSGVKVNAGCEVAVRSGMDVLDDDTSTITWSSVITEIGYDWKTFNRNTFQYDITPDLVYFVKTKNNAVWKLWFTAYNGGAEGKYVFNKKEIKRGVNTVPITRKLKTSLFPNPALSNVHIDNQEPTKLNVEIVDTYGRIIYIEELPPYTQSKINVESFASGLYSVRFSSGNNSDIKKLIIE